MTGIQGYTTYIQAGTDVAVDMEGNSVVVWESDGQDSPGESQSRGLFARLVDTAGIPQGNEFQVNSYTPFVQTSAAVAMTGGGDFVVVWENRGQTGFSDSILARRFAPDGTPEGSHLQVASSFTSGFSGLGRPDVAASSDGGFVVAWQQGDDVFARSFDGDGTPQAEKFLVNTYTQSSQGLPAVASDGDRDFVVVWLSTILLKYDHV